MVLDPSSDLTDLINRAHFGVDRSRVKGRRSIKFVCLYMKAICALQQFTALSRVHVIYRTVLFCLSGTVFIEYLNTRTTNLFFCNADDQGRADLAPF